MFSNLGITHIHHYAPLHYLPFIGRSRSLKSKPALADSGFESSHFRSTSSRTDIKRGFGNYAFLTLQKDPRILKAKLNGGFPHIEFLIPIQSFNGTEFDLCRYNVAKSRRTTDSPLGGFRLDGTNGKYYGDMKLPVARSDEDKKALLNKHYPAGQMIEVLVPHEYALPNDTCIACYHQDDYDTVLEIKNQLGFLWDVSLRMPPGPYQRKQEYVEAVNNFIQTALNDDTWKGSGLEFDRV